MEEQIRQRAPSANRVYSKEKIPVVFQNEEHVRRLASIRTRLEMNINEAAYLAARHP
jgi:hypothetical protein